MASPDKNVSSDTQLDAKNGGEAPDNVTDSLTEQSENAKQMLSSDSNGIAEGGNDGKDTPSDHKTLENENNEKNAAESNQGAAANGAIPKKSRRVHFIDGKLVSGFCDPPNPWNNASECSTEELVCAYQIACEKHGIKPIPKLLHQLKGINDFCDRNETLTLKGERIDYKHCDTFEEVLRRVQFRTFDLEGTHLEEEGAIALFDMVEYYESCTKLNLSFNKNIGIRGWQSCARMLKRTPCIEQLDVRNTGLTEQVMPMLGRALRLGSQLTVLHLESAILSGRPLMILVTAIKMNEILRELYLADNKLMPSDGIQLGNMLKFNHKLALLDLRNNHLQDVGTSHLCDGLYEQSLGAGLNTLVLWNNQITYQSMPSLARSLTSTKSLETLNLGHNNVTNEGIHRLKEGLLLNKSLLRIGLQAAKVTCEGSVALAEYIADSTRLLRIDLRENDIKTGGLMALSLSLKVSETVTRIDLDKEPKRESGMKDYADQQRRLLQDISNLMLRNRDLLRQREEEERQRKEKEKEEEAKKEVQDKENENEAQASENEAQADVEVPEVVALDDVVPQLIVPKDTAAETKDGEVNVDKEVEVKEEEIKPETESLAQCLAQGLATMPTVQTIEESTDLEKEKKDSLFGAARKGEQFHLDLPLTSTTMTLESPAFIPESAMPVVLPPSEEDVARQAAEQSAALLAASPEYNPLTFPPSPMVGTAKPIATTLSPEVQGNVKSKELSPNARRKFTISRVEESASPVSKSDPPAKHSTDTMSASGDSSSQQPSAFQSPGNGNHGNNSDSGKPDTIKDSQGADDLSESFKEQVSLTDDNCADSNVDKDLNENPTDRVSIATDSVTTETTSQQAEVISSVDDITSGSETDNSAKSVTSKSNETTTSENTTTDENKTTAIADNNDSNDTNHNMTIEEAQKLPDFHTNLSLNGMKVELANVIDSLDKSGKAAVAQGSQAAPSNQGDSDGSNESPDDFEKELDELLANLPPAPAVLQQSKPNEDQSVSKETVEQQS